jgi:hypothetical protein
VLQKVSSFREKIHCFTISPFRETFCFARIVKYRDAKQTKCFTKWPPVSRFSLFCDTDLAVGFAKGSFFSCFAKRFVICVSEIFRETDAKQAKNFAKNSRSFRLFRGFAKQQ